MTCYHPQRAWDTGKKTETGKTKYLITGDWITAVTHKNGDRITEYTEIPCGRCIGCREDKAKEWANRLINESKKNDPGKVNYFVTLTYEHPGRSLEKKDLQNFIKRWRKKFGSGIKYFACGEYTPLHQHPHYHIVFINTPEIELEKFGTKYRSKELEKIWDKGFSTIGILNNGGIMYTCQYTIKKQKKILIKHHEILEDDGRTREFIVMSKHLGEINQDEDYYVNGKKVKTPQFMVKRLRDKDPTRAKERSEKLKLNAKLQEAFRKMRDSRPKKQYLRELEKQHIQKVENKRNGIIQ